MYTCHSPKYHYIIVTVVYLRRGSVIIVLVSRMNKSAWMLGMLEIEENLRTPKYFLGSGLVRNIYTRYHICYMRIKSRRVSLER